MVKEYKFEKKICGWRIKIEFTLSGPKGIIEFGCFKVYHPRSTTIDINSIQNNRKHLSSDYWRIDYSAMNRNIEKYINEHPEIIKTYRK